MRSVLRRLAVGAFALSAAVFGLAAPAHAAATTGSISGHFSQDGQTVGASVALFDSSCSWLKAVSTDNTNTFSFTNLQPGQYILHFSPDIGRMQWYHTKLSCTDADLVTVTAGEQTVVEETALATGTVSGHVTDASGAPVQYVQVTLESPDGSGSAYGFTDEDGAYQVDAPAGQYRVSYRLDDYATEYAHQQIDQDRADIFTVVIGQDTVVDEQLLPTGSMSGQFTDASGKPVEGEQVSVEFAANNMGAGFATTDANGEYSIPTLFVGAYKVNFSSADGSQQQYATGKRTFEAADTFTVAAGRDTRVSDRVLATGSIRVTAKDGSTSASIADFCAGSGSSSGCSNGSGQVLLTDVQEGAEQVYVYTNDGRYFSSDDNTVTVLGGQTVDIEATLRPAAVITTTIVDASTGAPVPWACALPMNVGNAVLPDETGYCADDQGVVHMGPLNAGLYNVFVYPHGEYGAQWVGPDGGTGNQLTAKIVKATTDKPTTISPIKLDPASTITGTVTDAIGAPVTSAFVGINTQHPGVGGGGVVAVTNASGRYTLSGLGPYRWPIVSGGHGYATQWSGGVANRYLATPLTVTAGSATTYNPVLASGSTLKGTALTGAGAPLTGYVLAYNAVTGDIMGSQWVDSDGVISFPVFGPQLVKIRYQLEDADNHAVDGWYGGADQQHAKVVGIPVDGSVTITINTN